MADAVGPCLSSTTGVGSMGASTGEGIVSTSMNSSGCLVSCSGSAASRGALLLHVFLPAWLDAPIFGGAIVGSGWFLLTNSSLVSLCQLTSALRALSLCNFTISQWVLCCPCFPFI
jgi:hypothetical protein